jgi:hypothetical protein
MKKNTFLFAMLTSITSSATVTVKPLDVNYGAKTVKFRVEWTGTAANNRVWVWVDLCPVTGTTAGTFAKAVISGAAATAGSIATVAGNTRGFYVTTNPSTVTATLSNATGQFNWCAYGSDFPPNAIDNSSGGYALRGSPPFVITTSSGTTEVSVNAFSGGIITALTDATGCPGLLCGKNGEAAGVLNCCVTGTANCSGTCTTTQTYTTCDGNCTDQCNTAYLQLRDQCGNVINNQYSSCTNASCTANCVLNTNDCAGCTSVGAAAGYGYCILSSTCTCYKNPCIVGSPSGGWVRYVYQSGEWILSSASGSATFTNCSFPLCY